MPKEILEQVKAMEDFPKDITKSTQYTCRQISILDDWLETAPVEEKDLQEYLYDIRSKRCINMKHC